MRPIPFLMMAALAAGCATPRPVLRGVASPASLSCATSVLESAGYGPTRDNGFIVGERRLLAGDVGVTREFVEVRLVQDSVLEVTSSASRIEAAMHGLPVQRQTASSVEPSPETSELASTVLAQCGS